MLHQSPRRKPHDKPASLHYMLAMQPALSFLLSPVTKLKGVGPAVASALGRLLLGDEKATPLVRDLLFHPPGGVVDRGFSPPLREAPDGKVATFVVRVEAHHPPMASLNRHARRPYRVTCFNETGDITLLFFNQRGEYLKQLLPVGEKRVISGKVEHFEFRAQMPHPDIIAPASALAQVMRVEPIYPLAAGLNNKRLAALIQSLLPKLPDLAEWIAPEYLAARGWPGWKHAVASLHQPVTGDDLSPLSPARERLAYDECLSQQLQLSLLRRRQRMRPGPRIEPKSGLRARMESALPFTLTEGQQQALREIGADMASGKRMVRFLQGDVGSGKTLVALSAMLDAAAGGYQSALMAPTEIIAGQHYRTLATFCGSLPDIRVALLTGNVRGAERRAIYEGVKQGEIHLVVGTHALFQEAVEFHRLGVCVIDEQHRFGVEQRMKLAAKGESPHLLHMSATPIPRSLTMTLYGDMDCSTLREKPAGRLPITTRAVPMGRYEEMMEGLHRAIAKGEKIYWICPLIAPSGDALGLHENDQDIAAAESRATEFRARFGHIVGLAHGRMKADARQEVMEAFRNGDVRVLVATTVVEVGVDVQDATIIVIEQADRFGLSQLHQLRGRVGRGEKPSSCVLLYGDRAGETAIQRLSILRETEDGFRIAEADLHIRGGGELLGLRQSGLPQFRFADILVHEGLLAQARNDITQFLATDPKLITERGEALKTLLALFGHTPPE